jgi:hypothetical protein
MANNFVSQATLAIYKMYIKRDHPSQTPPRPERRALVIVSQVELATQSSSTSVVLAAKASSSI